MPTDPPRVPVVPGRIVPARDETIRTLRPRKHPNMAERVIEVVRNLLAIVALILAIVIMVALMEFGSTLGDSLDRLKAPTPAATGCPFGEGECGG